MQSLLSLNHKQKEGISPRKMEIEAGSNMNSKEYYLQKYKTSKGFISTPSDVWRSMTPEQRKIVLDHNGSKKRSLNNKVRESYEERETKRLRRAVREIVDEEKKEEKPVVEVDPNLGEERERRAERVPKFAFKVKRR